MSGHGPAFPEAFEREVSQLQEHLGSHAPPFLVRRLLLDVGGFTEQLRSIKNALENRDFVALCDTLAYETTETSNQWRAAIVSMRSTIE